MTVSELGNKLEAYKKRFCPSDRLSYLVLNGYVRTRREKGGTRLGAALKRSEH